MFITANSGVGAVTRVPVGVWRSLPETWELATRIIREADAVARGLGIPLSGSEADAAIATLEQLPPNVTVSMQRDIHYGRSPFRVGVSKRGGGAVRSRVWNPHAGK
jgi:2-dehydropantoate 2-reductase